ncbi:PREDICTED: clathrin light chain 2 [Fragaria vesca subsp. vesca]|uniref:clathrin light chain 2 n=1 Tax=Fragaria vesca subsp. vesca TaxID=101020 RepID=UPI0002C364EC|nr:PREDICTED: clathrin light chain 2 [Fragaria vesca subsp. vesca]
MSSSSFTLPDDDSVPTAGSTRPFDDDDYLRYEHDSVVVDDVFATAQPLTEPPSPPSIFAAGSNDPILPEMPPEEGAALREWRRQNAIHLAEKEKREKELLSQIIEEAEEFKVEFYQKRKIASENNKAANREKEKMFVASQEKFHAEVDKNYWKAVADLIPNEVPAIEKRGRKDQEKKPSVVVVQGPKPGKPTELSRMRQILLKLKHNTPPHLKPLPPAPVAAPEAVAATVAVAPEAISAA